MDNMVSADEFKKKYILISQEEDFINHKVIIHAMNIESGSMKCFKIDLFDLRDWI